MTPLERHGDPIPDDIREELEQCHAAGCRLPAVWRHRCPWGPHWCAEHVGQVPELLTYLYRHRETGRYLDD